MEGGLRKVIATYNFEMQNEKPRSPINEILRDMVEEEYHPLTETEIVRVVTEYFNISASDVKSRSRSENVVMARYIIADLLFEMLGLTLNAIGRIIKRDHSTVSYGISKIQKLKETDYKTQNLIKFLEKKLEAKKE